MPESKNEKKKTIYKEHHPKGGAKKYTKERNNFLIISAAKLRFEIYKAVK